MNQKDSHLSVLAFLLLCFATKIKEENKLKFIRAFSFMDFIFPRSSMKRAKLSEDNECHT